MNFKITEKSIEKVLKRFRAEEKRKTIVILLGAGGAKPWGGPLASDLESVIMNDSRFVTSTDRIPVGRFIFGKLREFYTASNEVNFETFLGFLESLLDYVFSETNEGRSPSNTSFSSFGFKFDDWISEIKDFYISQDLSEDRVMLHLPAGNPNGAEEESGNVERIFFFELYEHFMGLIARELRGYVNRFDEYDSLNDSLKEFIDFLIKKKYNVRIYTTNYDRLFPRILASNYKVFDGFHDDPGVELNERHDYKISRISKDRDAITYYNLHGSLYWCRQLILPDRGIKFYCYPNQIFPDIDRVNLDQVNPGQVLLGSNIVTGYNKVQRVSLEPLNYFNNAFMRHCLDSEILVSVGYSFNDIHINRTLKIILNKPKFSFYNITKNTVPDDFFSSREFSTLDELREVSVVGLPPFQENEDKPFWHLSQGEQIIRGFYLNGFDGFLENEEWLKMKL